MESEEGNLDLVIDEFNWEGSENNFQLDNIWKTERGLFLTSSSFKQYMPSENIEIEIVTLKELDSASTPYSMKNVELSGKRSRRPIPQEECRFISSSGRNEYDIFEDIKISDEIPVDNCDTQCSLQYDTEILIVSRSGTNSFWCNICSKEFKRSSHKKRHMLTHTGIKPFICDVCHKRFSRKSYLNSHMLIHANKAFSCGVCSKTFATGFHLKRHFVTHSGEKGFLCKFCKKTFGRQDNFKKHTRKHTSKQ